LWPWPKQEQDKRLGMDAESKRTERVGSVGRQMIDPLPAEQLRMIGMVQVYRTGPEDTAALQIALAGQLIMAALEI
jgi:hypothetical protein